MFRFHLIHFGLCSPPEVKNPKGSSQKCMLYRCLNKCENFLFLFCGFSSIISYSENFDIFKNGWVSRVWKLKLTIETPCIFNSSLQKEIYWISLSFNIQLSREYILKFWCKKRKLNRSERQENFEYKNVYHVNKNQLSPFVQFPPHLYIMLLCKYAK